MPDADAFKLKIPPAVTQYLKPDAPRDARMMAAKGLVPMTPSVLATVLTFFLGDADEEIKREAQASLDGMPPGMVQKLVKEELHPKTLDFFARKHVASEPILEGVLLNKLATDDTFVFLAERVPERLANLVGQNQVRLLRTPAIAEALKKNPRALKSEIDRMVSFLRMNGVVLEGESAELTSQEIKEILNVAEPTGAENLPEELLDQKLDTEEQPLTDEKKKTLSQRVQAMNVAQKIKLALLGNKEARSMLIKDSNKVVASSVVKSPRITEGEVLSIAQMRTTHDEVIRIISNNHDWTKNYNLQVALSNNPKTPFPVALKFLRQLRVPELLKLSKNKNIPSQLAKISKELHDQKRK